MNRYDRYVPRTIGELRDLLGSMMLTAPTFRPLSGYFPNHNIETEFHALNEGLRNVRSKIGEERYQAALALSARMRAHFEADQENKTHDTIAGRELIHEIEDLLSHRKKKVDPTA